MKEGKEGKEKNENISKEEREHLISELHRFLVWVGEKIPEEIELKNGEIIKLEELVWYCVCDKEFSDEERKRFMEIVNVLETKEKYNEDMLLKARLTHEDAKKLYHETAAIIRAILDLRECGTGKKKFKDRDVDEIIIRRRIDDTKRWLGFLKTIKHSAN